MKIDAVNTGMDAVITKYNSIQTGIVSNTETDTGVIYEPTEKIDESNAELIARLKDDSEKRVASFKKLVEDMFRKQGITFETSNDGFWKTLASGDFEVDAATKQKAIEEISEGGYWSVEETSERIFSFAQALSGSDPEKMEDMLDAFKKGFEQATKAWGRELPEISQRTYDAVLNKFKNNLNN